MNYDLTMPVLWHKYRPDLVAVNALGNKNKAFNPPIQISVFGWYMARSTEPNVNGHAERVISDAYCFPTTTQGVGPCDRIELPGYGVFEVDGTPANWDNNAWWSPGLVQCTLRKVDG